MPSRNENTREGLTLVCDIATLLIIPCTLAAVACFHSLVLACNICLLSVLSARIWLTPNIPRLLPADFVVLVMSAITLLRLPFALDVGIPRESSLVTGTLLYWALRTVRHQLAAIRWTLSVAAVLGAGLAVFSVLGSYAWITRVRAEGFQDVTALKGNASSVIGGPINEWATVLILLLVLQTAAIRRVSHRRFERHALAVGRLVILLTALCLTFSRGAYIAAVVFGAALLLLMCGSFRFEKRVRWPLVAAVILIAGASVFLANAVSGGAVVQTARYRATEQQRRSTSGRLQVWASAVGLASSHWLIGSGPGTFAMRYVPKAGLAEGRSFVGRPLNTLLALIIEEGLVGVILQALLPFAILIPVVRGTVRMSSSGAYRVSVLAIGWCAFWIREMTFSSLLENSAVMGIYWVLLALLVLGTSPMVKMRADGGRPSTRAVLGVIVAASVLVFVWDDRWMRAGRAGGLAAQAAEIGDTTAALEAADKAVLIRPSPYYLGLRAVIRSLATMSAFAPEQPLQVDFPEKRHSLQVALRDLENALAANADDPLFWHNRAWIRIRIGERPQQVIPDMQRAVKIDGGTAPYRVSLGLVLEWHGKANDAIEQYAAALAASPDICDSEFARNLKKRGAPLWAGTLSKAVGILRARDPADRDLATRARLAKLYFEQGQVAPARAMLETVTIAMPQFPGAWANQGRVYWKTGDFEQAELSFNKAIFLDSRDPIARDCLARAAIANGDLERAETIRNQAMSIAGQPASTHAKRVGHVYKTSAALRDDVLPHGLLAYCSPSVASERADERGVESPKESHH